MPADRCDVGELLSAYLDGELDEDQKAIVESRLREDGATRRHLELLRRVTVLAKSLPRHAAPESIEQDIQHQLERSCLLGNPEAPVRAGVSRGGARRMLGLAASLILAALAGWWALESGFRRGIRESAPVSNSSPISETFSPVNADIETSLNRAGTPESRKSDEPDSKHHTFEEKLAARVPVDELRRHEFAREELQLHVQAAGESDRDALAELVRSEIASSGLFDLRSESEPKRRSDIVVGNGLFLVGDPVVNHAENGSRQILVGGTYDQIDSLLRRIQGSVAPTTSVSMRLGGAAVKGLEPIRVVLSELGGGGSHRPGLAREKKDTAVAARSTEVVMQSSRSAFERLLQSMGVDPAVLSEFANMDDSSGSGEAELKVEEITSSNAKSPSVGADAIPPAGPDRVRIASGERLNDHEERLPNNEESKMNVGKDLDESVAAPVPPSTSGAKQHSFVERRIRELEIAATMYDSKDSSRSELVGRKAPVSRDFFVGPPAPRSNEKGPDQVGIPTEDWITLVIQVRSSAPISPTLMPRPNGSQPARSNRNGSAR